MKRKPTKNDLSEIAVMSLNEGEEIFAGLVSEHIPQVGKYKLLAKKKVDGTIEWAHFVQRDNGLKEKVMRGEVHSTDEFNLVADAVNSQLKKIFGVTMQPATYDVRTMDGKNVSDTMH